MILFSEGSGKSRKCNIESSVARNSIGNGCPVQKHVGAMVLKSIRVVLVAENDSIEVASNPRAQQTRSQRPTKEVLPLLYNWEKVPLFYTVYVGSHQLGNVAHT